MKNGLVTLNQIEIQHLGQGWLTYTDLGLIEALTMVWDSFIQGFKHHGIFLSEEKYYLIWSWNESP